MPTIHIKNKLNSLLQDYLSNHHKSKATDGLFILIYFHPSAFGISLKDELLHDFLSTLYPNVLHNIFSKYNKSKSSFFTFVCTCLKYQAKCFLRKIYLKNAIDETIVNQLINTLNNKLIEDNNLASSENTLDLYTSEQEYQDKDMQKMLCAWLLETKLYGIKKNYRKAIFILACKIAYLLDEDMISTIANYIQIPQHLLRYYISKLNLEYAMTSNARKVFEVRCQRDKYFVRKSSAEALLNNGNLSESSKNSLQCSKEYSLEQYKRACIKLEGHLQTLSNRTIAKVTGISRSTIDRTLNSISDILKHKPAFES
ncbi:MAG: hypothetical protein ACTTKH_05760 [Treponema sp.]